jgi:long-chain acyl-CoA synthetase
VTTGQSKLVLGTMLRRNAKHYPDKVAIVFEDSRVTYGDLNRRVNQTAHSLLQLGVGMGDKVALLLSNSMEMFELFWATAKIGAVVVPLNPMVQGKDLIRLLRDCEAKVLVVAHDYITAIEPIKDELSIEPEQFLLVSELPVSGYTSYQELTNQASSEEPAIVVDESAPYNIMYSSGTTGLPKGIVHTHKTRAMTGLSAGMGFGISFDSVILCAGSLVFNGSLAYMFPAMCAAATYVLLPKFSAAKATEAIRMEKVTHTVMVPTQIIQILDSKEARQDDLATLRVLLSLGSPLPVERKKEFIAKYPGVLYELYGTTEGFSTVLRPEDMLRKMGSVGCPSQFNEYMIMDEDGNKLALGEIGEIVGTGPTLMTGYYNNPEATEKAFYQGSWVKTGDLGYMDEEGFLYLVDRKKDMIISGGVNVYPKDIEEVLAEHPSVSESAVFAVPHEKWGEVPCAHITLKEGSESSEDALLQWVNERVSAKYQRLHGLKVVAEFPRSAAGKILKRTIREAYWQTAKP